MSQSPELGGGEGFTYEGDAAAFYLSALLAKDYAPGIDNRTVVCVSVQQRGFGEPLDDVIVDFEDKSKRPARLSLQVKRALTISKAKTNADFREVVHGSWATLAKPGFRRNTDRYGAAVGTIAAEKERGLRTLCELARESLTPDHFDARFAEDGSASDDLGEIRDDVAALLREAKGAPCTSEELHRFLAHFVLIRFDFLCEGAVTPCDAINRIKACLAPADALNAPLVWSRFVELARASAGKAGQFDRARLVREITSLVCLREEHLEQGPRMNASGQSNAPPDRKAGDLIAMLAARHYPRTLLKRVYLQSQPQVDLRMVDAKTEEWLFDLEDSRARGPGYPGPLIEFAERLGREAGQSELRQWAQEQCALGEYASLANQLDREQQLDKPLANLFIEISGKCPEQLSWWLEGLELGATSKQHVAVGGNTLRDAVEMCLPTIISHAEAVVKNRYTLRIGFIVPAELFVAGLESVRIACPDESDSYILNKQYPVLYHWEVRAQGKIIRYINAWQDILDRVRHVIEQRGNAEVHWLQDAMDAADTGRFARASQELRSGSKGAVCLGIDEPPPMRLDTIIECLRQGIPCLFWLTRPTATNEAAALRDHIGLAFAGHTPVRAPLSVWQQQKASRSDRQVDQLVWDLPELLPEYNPSQSRFEEHP